MPKKKQAGDVTTIGLVQMNCVPEPEKNLKKAIAGINDAAKRGAQIISVTLLCNLGLFVAILAICRRKIERAM